jgi:hypothetical protein
MVVEMSKIPDIYTMALHDEIHLGKFLTIRRVPGGWLYIDSTYAGPDGYALTSSFVPYPENEEFHPGSDHAS